MLLSGLLHDGRARLPAAGLDRPGDALNAFGYNVRGIGDERRTQGGLIRVVGVEGGAGHKRHAFFNSEGKKMAHVDVVPEADPQALGRHLPGTSTASERVQAATIGGIAFFAVEARVGRMGICSRPGTGMTRYENDEASRPADKSAVARLRSARVPQEMSKSWVKLVRESDSHC